MRGNTQSYNLIAICKCKTTVIHMQKWKLNNRKMEIKRMLLEFIAALTWEVSFLEPQFQQAPCGMCWGGETGRCWSMQLYSWLCSAVEKWKVVSLFPGSSLGSLHSIVVSSGAGGPLYVKSSTFLLFRFHSSPSPHTHLPQLNCAGRWLAAGCDSQLSCLLPCQRSLFILMTTFHLSEN